MNRRLRDLRRALLEVAAPHGAKVEIRRTNGGHLRSTFKAGGIEVAVVTSSTPSDWRTSRNNEALVRRKLRTVMPMVSV